MGVSCQREPTCGQTRVELNYPLYSVPMFISLSNSRDIRGRADRDRTRARVRRYEENADHVLDWPDGRNDELARGRWLRLLLELTPSRHFVN